MTLRLQPPFNRWLNIGLVACIATDLACGASDAPQGLPPAEQGESAPPGDSTELEPGEARVAGAEPGAASSCEPESLSDEGSWLPTWMALQGEHVYWLEERSSELRRVPRSGGVVEVVAQGMDGWLGITSDEGHIYTAGNDGAIHRLAPDGSEDRVLGAGGGDRMAYLQLSGPRLYWQSVTGGVGEPGYVAQIRHVSRDGSSAVETLWSSPSNQAVSGFAVARGNIFTAVFGWPPGSRELLPDGQLLRMSEAGGEPVSLATGLMVPRVHAADERFVYYSAQSLPQRHSELWRVSIDGGAPELLRPGRQGDSVDVGQMVLEGDTAWWGQANESRILRAAAGSASSTAVEVEAHHLLGLAADASHLYFTSSGSFDAIGPAAVWRVSRACLD